MRVIDLSSEIRDFDWKGTRFIRLTVAEVDGLPFCKKCGRTLKEGMIVWQNCAPARIYTENVSYICEGCYVMQAPGRPVLIRFNGDKNEAEKTTPKESQVDSYEVCQHGHV